MTLLIVGVTAHKAPALRRLNLMEIIRPIKVVSSG
jgi:hypothetical protein